MKLGVFAVLLSDQPLERMLDTVVELGLDTVEIGAGAYPGDAHCKPAELLASDRKLHAFRDAFRQRDPVLRLAHEVDVVALHAHVHDAKIGARRSP